jgi:hypothetical protein
MGWRLRKSIKVAPGLRINLSKSGVSASIGGKGFTYNTRGRITAGIPGTGIRYTQNLNSRRKGSAMHSVVGASGRMDPTTMAQLSKREVATRDFVVKVSERTTNALLRYFNSHGVYVLEDDLSEALMLDEHQGFLESLSHNFEVTAKAVKLGVDIGSISLAEKEKAMLALYEIEQQCADHRGDRGQLDVAAASLARKVREWPASPTFTDSFLAGLVACTFLLLKFYALGFVFLAGAVLYGIFRLTSYEKKRTSQANEIAEANDEFDSLVTIEISPRPTLLAERYHLRLKAFAFAGVISVGAVAALIYHPQGLTRNEEPVASQPVENVSQANASTSPASSTGVPSEVRSARPDFTWLTGKYPSDVVKDRRFRTAFAGVSRAEWKKIEERLAVTNMAGITLKDGYYFGEGCKAHFCDSDKAAFAIAEATGKGDLIYKETVNYTTGKAVANRFAWNELPISATPLTDWAKSNDMTIDSSHSQPQPQPLTSAADTALQASFDCAKARSDAEVLICHDPELAADDVELAAIFLKAKVAVADQAALRERTKDEWSYREQNCHDRDCLVRWYTDQKAVLTQIAETGNVAEK